MRDNIELEEVWAQRRSEAQEKLANISLHSPKVLAGPVTWNNKELVEKWNQRRKEAQRELEEKRIQDGRETEMFVQALREGKMSGPQKVKVEYVRVHKKWTIVGKGAGKVLSCIVTKSTTTPVPSTGSGVFMFGSARKPASNDQALGGTRSPICRTVNKKIKNYFPSKESNGIVSPKKRKTSKKLKRHNKHSKWLLEQEHRNTIRAIKSEGDRRQLAYRIREQPRNKYVLCENKKPAIHVGRKRRRAWYIAPMRRFMVRKYRGRAQSNQSKNTTNNIVQERIFNNKISLRQPSSPGSLLAMLRSNKRYKPGD